MIELVIPAANKPIESKYLAPSPKIGAKPKAKSAALFIVVASTPAAVMIMLMDINPPRVNAINKSFIAKGRSAFDDHFSRTNSVCKNKL